MKKILLIDDNRIDQTILTKLFSYYGVKLEIANDGEEGIQLAVLIQPSLMLLDVKMPVMDGFETLGQLKQNEMVKDVPVIMLSAGIITLEEEAAVLLNTAGILKKPVSPQDIKALLEKYKILED